MSVIENQAPTQLRERTYVGAINEALDQMLEIDPDVFVAGEDVGANGGVFGTFAGLQSKYGELRSVDTPISELGFTGASLGASATGVRCVADLMF